MHMRKVLTSLTLWQDECHSKKWWWKASHYTLLKNELDARGIKYDATREHFTQLKKKLRHDEIKKRENFNDAQFEQLLVDSIKKDVVFKKITAFEPIHRNDIDWAYASSRNWT